MTTGEIEGHSAQVEDFVTPDIVRIPADATEARLGLGRAGSSLPTRATLDFAFDHARARDAVHAPLDFDTLRQSCAELELEQIVVESACNDRQTYLRRPDLGRRLSEWSRTALSERRSKSEDVIIVVADGLSSKAVQEGAAALLSHLVPRLRSMHLSLGPLVFVKQARVAIADEIGALCKARLSIILVGERPGLSAADSLGAYITLDPGQDRTDANRNCVSNIRTGGLSYQAAAFKMAWLVDNAFRSGASGVTLKDDSASAMHPVDQSPQTRI
ncbi:ethanolamine ammonia-lyase subunit EutC [Rhizobium sp. BK602]|uniref:ethanolamine ammonia-lyase subunit EutC n=1 Tax=Rhizobium sp. BK602 TaxID=2586986 RepID=UPI00161BE37C|nr:ethanolamine ammonia-lyase subunit EutC [Rhizobium sp. BK602]MBB3612513.1 ethanolamine ammonia-lyase small subunit [Rhizobium sp. BK602]